MSKHNKVNPGTYTQAGRLSQDDAARERLKQVDADSTHQLEGRPHAPFKPAKPDDAETDAKDDELADESDDEMSDDSAE